MAKYVKGQSGNPGGRPKIPSEFRVNCRNLTDGLVFAAWEAEVRSLGENWIEASKLLAAYGYGRPKESVEVTHRSHADVLAGIPEDG